MGSTRVLVVSWNRSKEQCLQIPVIGERVEGRTGATAGSCLGGDPRVLRVSHSMIDGITRVRGDSRLSSCLARGFPFVNTPEVFSVPAG